MLKFKTSVAALLVAVSLSACSTTGEWQRKQKADEAEVMRLLDEIYVIQKRNEQNSPKLAESMIVWAGQGKPAFNELPLSNRDSDCKDCVELVSGVVAGVRTTSSKYSQEQYEAISSADWAKSSCDKRFVGKSASGTVFVTCSELLTPKPTVKGFNLGSVRQADLEKGVVANLDITIPAHQAWQVCLPAEVESADHEIKMAAFSKDFIQKANSELCQELVGTGEEMTFKVGVRFTFAKAIGVGPLPTNMPAPAITFKEVLR